MPRKKTQTSGTGKAATPALATSHDGDRRSEITAKPERHEPRYRTERRRVDALKPNSHNARLFPDSLSPDSIALLAEDLKATGLQVPVRIMPDDVLVDGERRWCAAKQLGWEEIDVVVGPQLTDAQLLDRVISASTSARQMTLREQVNIYVAIAEQYRRDEGRGPGRPRSKTTPNGESFLSAKQIAVIAARKARFDSTKTADRAAAIFLRGDEELREQVVRGELSIGAAYEKVPKRPRRPTAAIALLGTPDRADAHDKNARSHERSPLALPSGEDGAELAVTHDSKGAADAESREDEDVAPGEAVDATTPLRLYEGELVDDAEVLQEEFSEDVLASGSAIEPDEPETITVDQAIDRVCEHLGALVEEDRRAAKNFFGRLIRRMQAILTLNA